ncbi:MAG: endonuclease domain-containing protein [Candidatus Uhrbacteria bacterium]
MQLLYNLTTQKALRQTLRNEASPAEGILWSFLMGRKFHGLKFRRQHGIGPYVVDFYCPEARLVVEVDGQSHFEEGERESDIARTKYVESKGIVVVRVANGDVYGDMEKVLRKIEVGLPARIVKKIQDGAMTITKISSTTPDPSCLSGGGTCKENDGETEISAV